MTDAERHLWYRLRGKQVEGLRFRRQHPIGPYVVDFVCLSRRLIVELDGGQHAEQAGYDRTRDSWLSSEGFRVLRFWNDQVFKQTDEVLAVIYSEMERRSFPPPLGGGGRGRGKV
ncbi:MAG: DNA (cytosine-5-)-methyltransferase [Gammaproteobacteria bacterium RIFOXYA12_FULL_61_12]|nr:MAG: DNA (cytosine-5-)-methyltransferase [Gammaproteobacteria bacterium RIFOXYA12_FULL_61_12]OGT89536.1 MAG: DNA (cytosine-5-)-methyltransferase [Gammaproteobacteria bacterium RIFOXYD12_FULL_61_37]